MIRQTARVGDFLHVNNACNVVWRSRRQIFVDSTGSVHVSKRPVVSLPETVQRGVIKLRTCGTIYVYIHADTIVAHAWT